MARYYYFVIAIVLLNLLTPSASYPAKSKLSSYESYEETEEIDDNSIYPDESEELDETEESEEWDAPFELLTNLHPGRGMRPRFLRTTGKRALEALMETPKKHAIFDLINNILHTIHTSSKAELRRLKLRNREKENSDDDYWKK